MQSINYTGLIPICVSELKNQNIKIKNLEYELKKMEDKLNLLMEKYNKELNT